MKKQVKYISAGMLAGMLLCGGQMQAANTMSGMHVCVTDAIQKDNRPEVSKTSFPFECGRKGNHPCAETSEKRETGMDVRKLFPQYHRHYRTLPQRRGWQTGHIRLYGRHSRNVAS